MTMVTFFENDDTPLQFERIGCVTRPQPRPLVLDFRCGDGTCSIHDQTPDSIRAFAASLIKGVDDWEAERTAENKEHANCGQHCRL
jgi:hypothetical protein